MTNYQDLFADLTDGLDLDELTAVDNHNADDNIFDDLSDNLDLSNEYPAEPETNHNDGDELLNELTENLTLTLEERAVDGNRDDTGGVLTEICADGVNVNTDGDFLLNDPTGHLGLSTTKHDAENHNPDDALLSGLAEHLELTLSGHNQEANHNTNGTALSGLSEFLDQTLAAHPTRAAYFPNYANEIRNYNPPQVSLTELLQSGCGAARLHHSPNEIAGFRSHFSDGMVSTSGTTLVGRSLSRLESFSNEDGSTSKSTVMKADVSAKKKATLIEILKEALLLVSKE